MANRLVSRPLQLILVAVTMCSVSAPAATLQCVHLPQLFDFYLRHHYAYKTLSDTIKQRTVEQYIKNMDPSKTLFLEEDVTKLKGSLIKLFATVGSGDCSALDDAGKLMIQRAKENENFVRKFVSNNYKVDDSTTLILDPKKRPYPKTREEMDKILEKMVHFQIVNYLQAEMKLPEAKKHLIHRYELITKRLQERKMEDQIASEAEAFALALDPHSSFLSRDSLEDFQIHMQLSLEGIGASLTNQDGLTVIEELIPGGGAEKSKLLRAKDKIIAVAQESPKSTSKKPVFEKPVPIIDMDLREVVKLIRGKKGTRVQLTILRQTPKTETFDVAIMRDKIDIKEQAAKLTYEKIKEGNRTFKIGIIDLPSFYGGGGKGSRSCSVDVKAALDEAKKEKVDAIVLDLQHNGGGLLEEAVKISGLFIKKGGVVATKDNEAKVQVIPDEDEDVAWSGPLVVLTSRLSASASEILAGSLKDYHRAVIVGGDHTFGKGSVQVISTLPLELGAMKVTTGMFFLPGGRSTQHAGVASDVRLPSTLDTDDIGESALDYSLPPQSISSFLSADANGPGNEHWEPIDAQIVKKLAEKSKERVDKDAKFAEVRKNIEEQKKNAGIIKLAEMRKKSEKEKREHKKDGTPMDENATAKELDKPYISEAVAVAGDLIVAEHPQALTESH